MFMLCFHFAGAHEPCSNGGGGWRKLVPAFAGNEQPAIKQENLMVTTLDKAIVALIMAALSIMANFGVALPEWLTGENIAALFAALAPILVYLIPNKTS